MPKKKRKKTKKAAKESRVSEGCKSPTMQNLEQKDEMLVLLQELREDQKYLRSKQDELAQKMTKTDQTIRRMNEQATQATDEDLLGLNLEDVVEKLQACLCFVLFLFCFVFFLFFDLHYVLYRADQILLRHCTSLFAAA